jgi:hypothetical protein
MNSGKMDPIPNKSQIHTKSIPYVESVQRDMDKLRTQRHRCLFEQ